MFKKAITPKKLSCNVGIIWRRFSKNSNIFNNISIKKCALLYPDFVRNFVNVRVFTSVWETYNDMNHNGTNRFNLSKLKTNQS